MKKVKSINVIVYCRVSSDEQKDNTSLDFQEEQVKNYCNNRKYNIVGVYKEDFTAKHPELERPEMKKLYEYCKRNSNEVDKVLFLRWDRFSRNVEFAFKYIRIFNSMNIEVNSIENNINFENSDWPLLLAMYCACAQVENFKIIRRTRDGIRESLKKGRWPNTAPRGYKHKRISKSETRMEIDEEKAENVRRAFKEVALGVEFVCRIRRRLFPYIPESSFFDMLRNILYIGKVRVPPLETEERYEEERIVDGVFEAIIDSETFYKVQDVLDGKKKHTPKLSKKINPDLYLRKFLKCPKCGHALTGAVSRGNGGQYCYYNCCEDAKHIRKRAELVNKGFAKYVGSLTPNETVVKLYEKILLELRDDDKKGNKTQADKLQERLDIYKKRITNAKDRYFDNEISKKELEDVIERYSNEVKLLQERIDMLLNVNRSNIKPKLDYAMLLICNMERYILDAPVEAKIKLISSMFPEKIEFDGLEYRTNNYNKVLDLIFQETNKLRGYRNEKSERNSPLSDQVPRPELFSEIIKS